VHVHVCTRMCICVYAFVCARASACVCRWGNFPCASLTRGAAADEDADTDGDEDGGEARPVASVKGAVFEYVSANVRGFTFETRRAGGGGSGGGGMGGARPRPESYDRADALVIALCAAVDHAGGALRGSRAARVGFIDAHRALSAAAIPPEAARRFVEGRGGDSAGAGGGQQPAPGRRRGGGAAGAGAAAAAAAALDGDAALEAAFGHHVALAARALCIEAWGFEHPRDRQAGPRQPPPPSKRGVVEEVVEEVGGQLVVEGVFDTIVEGVAGVLG
jgi:hypothetical protein